MPQTKEYKRAKALERYWKNPERARETSRRWKLRHPDYVSQYARKNSVRYNYGLSFSEYEALIQKQHNLCAICEKPQNRNWRNGQQTLDVDHDHKTGEVRALLCNRCNRLIAGIELSSIDILSRLTNYLEKHHAI